MTTATEPVLALAERFLAAIAAGDVETVRAIYAPDARVWHNFDGIEQSVDEHVRVLKWMNRVLPDRHYDEVRRLVTAEGWVQQHVLRGTGPTGQPFEMPACIVATVVEGRITRLEEYLDSAQTAALRG